MTKVVLATHNEGKRVEMQQMLAPLGWELVSLASLDIPAPEETGLTFIENAILKARHAASIANLPAVADDSGLVVDALNGAPGIYSARYAGPSASDADNNAKLLQSLSSTSQRTAHFFCALAYLPHAEHPAPAIATGRWDGTILEQPQGDNGFGYDPLFFVASENATSAQLPRARKNALSHRGQAVTALLAQLQA